MVSLVIKANTLSLILKDLLCLCTFALLVGIFYFTGLFSSDDIQYVSGARSILHGLEHEATVGGARLTVSLPLAFFLYLTNDVAQYAVLGFISFYISLVLLTYYGGLLLFSRAVGLIAAILVLANPIIFYYSGAILPDNILAIFFLTHVIAMGYFIKLNIEASPCEGKKKIAIFIAGIAMGLCYATKEASLLFCISTIVRKFIAVFYPGFIFTLHLVAPCYSKSVLKKI
jgi:hypothetical protein